MSLELRREITASPEDLYGEKGWGMRLFGGNKLIKVADSIDDVRPIVASKGLLLEEFFGSYIPCTENQLFDDVKLSFKVDEVDGHVWVFEQEVAYFIEMFSEVKEDD